MTKLEEIARAICEADGHTWESSIGAGEIERRQLNYTRLARAAVEAMRLPSEAMIDAHTRRSRFSIPNARSHFTSEALSAWRAMIDAILNERSRFDKTSKE